MWIGEGIEMAGMITNHEATIRARCETLAGKYIRHDVITELALAREIQLLIAQVALEKMRTMADRLMKVGQGWA